MTVEDAEDRMPYDSVDSIDINSVEQIIEK